MQNAAALQAAPEQHRLAEWCRDIAPSGTPMAVVKPENTNPDMDYSTVRTNDRPTEAVRTVDIPISKESLTAWTGSPATSMACALLSRA